MQDEVVGVTPSMAGTVPSIFDGVVPRVSLSPLVTPSRTIAAVGGLNTGKGLKRTETVGGAVSMGKQGETRGDTLEPVRGGKRVIARVLRRIDAGVLATQYVKLFGTHRPISSLTDAELEAERVAVFARLCEPRVK